MMEVGKSAKAAIEPSGANGRSVCIAGFHTAVAKPIRNDADFNSALAEVEQYFDAPPAPGTTEAERFHVLPDSLVLIRGPD